MSPSASSFMSEPHGATGGQQPLNDQGYVDMNLPVRAINRSDAPIIWEYARQKHVLQPGVPTYVPYMAMVYWQGDPRAINVPGGKLHEQHRRHQREHLSSLYGIYENEEKWEQVPLVECYPLDSDIRFETVLHDPEGVHLQPQVAAASETEFLRKQLAAMQGQMQAMAAQIQMADATDAAVAASGIDDPADLERQATNTKSVAPDPATSLVGASPERRGAAARRPVAKGGAPVTKDA